MPGLNNPKQTQQVDDTHTSSRNFCFHWLAAVFRDMVLMFLIRAWVLSTHAHYNHFLHPHRTGPPKKGLYIWRSATQDENLYNSHKFPSRFCMSERNLITNFQWLQNEPQLHSRGRGQASAQDWCRPRPAPRLVERSPALDSATPTTCGDGRWLLMLTQYTILSPLLHLHLNLWLSTHGPCYGCGGGWMCPVVPW